ncbi:hypothetical protein EsH8_X_000244 [Colletotrichum jinshuiense]
MDHSRGPALALPVSNSNKPSEPPQRLRKKLQKAFPKHRIPSIRRAAPIEPSGSSNKLNTGVAIVAQQAGTVGQPSLRLSPDLSDAKWQEYVGESNAVQDAPDKPRVSVDTPAPALIPEFSHLAVSTPTSRPSLDSSFSSPTSTSSISTVSSMRRRAKTPIYTIGQLESPTCGRAANTADKVSSVDLIVDQYQALLKTQDTSSICTDTRSDPLPSRQPSLNRSSLVLSRYSDGETPAELRPDVYQPAPRRIASAHSPTSDDGTLVAFDEEAIYFKPLSFMSEPRSPQSPLPPPPPPRNRARLQRNRESHPRNHNLSLQIATDLLTRELSTTMLDGSQSMGTDISSLQIWVMIEAYERLRDQVLEMGLQNEQVQSLEPMFDTWLSALNSIHDRMTSDAQSYGSHYDVTDLQAEDLD